MSADVPKLRTRKPTGAVPWPFVLLEGEEKSGKSWGAATLTASKRVGECYWLDLNEGAADEYAAIPGANYMVIEHDGTYTDVLGQILAVKARAREVAAEGGDPVVLVIDSLSALWESLKDWVSGLAAKSAKNRAKLAQDPSADVDVSRNLWNLAGSRYRTVLTHLLTFPGIVVATARGKAVSATDPATGQPYRDNRKSYSVEGHKTLPYDATVWVRMTREADPLVVGARSVHAGIRPGADEPQHLEGGLDLDRLIFDILRCDPRAAHARDLRTLHGGELTDDEKADLGEQQQEQPRVMRPAPQAEPPAADPDTGEVAEDAAQSLAAEAYRKRTVDTLKALYDTAKGKGLLRAEVAHPKHPEKRMPLASLITVRKAELLAAANAVEVNPDALPDAEPEQEVA